MSSWFKGLTQRADNSYDPVTGGGFFVCWRAVFSDVLLVSAAGAVDYGVVAGGIVAVECLRVRVLENKGKLIQCFRNLFRFREKIGFRGFTANYSYTRCELRSFLVLFGGAGAAFGAAFGARLITYLDELALIFLHFSCILFDIILMLLFLIFLPGLTSSFPSTGPLWQIGLGWVVTVNILLFRQFKSKGLNGLLVKDLSLRYLLQGFCIIQL